MAPSPLDYVAVPESFRLPAHANFGGTSGIAFNSKGNIFVIHRGPMPLMEFDPDGHFIRGFGVFIAALMAVGALFGALNTMYSAVASRTREIATLRALGFGSSPIVLSVMFESLALALFGGVIGAVAAYFAFDGFKAATINWQTFSQIAFAFRVTPALLVSGLIWALFIGLIGGVFPAIRAARMPIAAALREL